jgi:hypothetical protein
MVVHTVPAATGWRADWDFQSLTNTRFERFVTETDAHRVALADNTARLIHANVTMGAGQVARQAISRGG